MTTDADSSAEALCPVCLRRLPARHEAHGEEIRLTRRCPEHGEFSAVIWRGEPSFAAWKRPKTPSAPPVARAAASWGCPFDCGLCPEHGQHTCTAVVEVTARCNLRCPVCYASSGADAPPPLSEPSPAALAERLALLRREAGPCNVQLSGGEPTCRDDLPEIIASARAQRFGLVQINTNGLRLAAEPGYARALAEAGLQSVFLQFDGPDEACLALRGRPLLTEKLDAIEACAGAGLGVVLVPTLVRGVNDHALGDIVRLATSLMPVVRGVHFQPAARFGRYQPGEPGKSDEAGRLTLPEVLTLLTAQSRGQLRPEHFHPPGCEHERCSFSARFAVQGGSFVPIFEGGCCGPDFAPASAPSAAIPSAEEGARQAKASVARQWAAAPPPSGAPPQDDFERFLAQRGADKRFSISCMAFQDVWSLELERVRGCCIHTQTADGRLIPFCLYNLTAADGTALYRENPA